MNMMIRGVPESTHHAIQRKAREENLSMNQYMVRLMVKDAEEANVKFEEEARRSEAFQKIRELRDKIRKKYGEQECSSKLIREMRDSRYGPKDDRF